MRMRIVNRHMNYIHRKPDQKRASRRFFWIFIFDTCLFKVFYYHEKFQENE